MVPIKVDTSGIPEQPTFVLATRSEDKLGQLVGLDGIKYHKCFNAPDEIYFDISKKIGLNDNPLFDEVEDQRLVWYREVDEWFRLSYELDEGDVTSKHVTGTTVCESELSQVEIHNLEINTEDDILRDDYVDPTIFYSDTDADVSLLDRILYKCPNYSIDHVAESLKGVQRQFSFDNTSVYDALMDVSEEVGCLFVFGNDTHNKKVRRSISAYDLMSYCNSCGKRFEEHTKTCPYCGSSNITEPYGTDSGIVVSRENLTKDVRLTSDTDAVKNCFYLQGGDDFMSDTIKFLTPDGSGYIWYFTNEMKKDMTEALRNKLDAHDALYEAYLTGDTSVTTLETILPYSVTSSDYNTLVTKYDPSYSDYSRIYSGGVTKENARDIVLNSYADLTEADYTAVDFYYYLNDSMMPTYTATKYTIAEQASRLASYLSSGLSLLNVTANTSQSTAETAIRSMSRHRVDRSKYDVTVNTTSWSATSTRGTWRGTCTLTDNSDSENTATTQYFTIEFTSNAQDYVNQLMQNRINNNVSEAYDIETLFGLSLADFRTQLTYYSLSCLKSFYDCCQGCMDILIRNGCGNPSGCSIGGVNYNTLYTNLYQPWYRKLIALQAEMDTRASEVATIQNMMDQIEQLISKTQDELDFESFVGEELWLEFIPYRREYTYTNGNYISDGLSNAEIINLATDFVSQATKELYKSAELQHSISSTLYNLLIIPEFSGLVDNFDVGVWIRVNIDGSVYLLRLLEYTVDWGNYSTIDVQFSDIDNWASGYSDLYSVISSARSMATGVGTIQRQAERGNTAASLLSRDLDLTNIKLVSNAQNQEMSYDEYGLYMREYDDIIETYSPEQLKITNKTIAFTDDDWETTRLALGKIITINHSTGEEEESYGLLAENIIGTFGSFVTLDVENINLTGSLTSSSDDYYLTWDLDDGEFHMGSTTGGDAISYDQDSGMILNASFMTLGTLSGPVYSGTANQRNYWDLATGEFYVSGSDGTTGIYHNGTTLTINASNLKTGSITSNSGVNYWNLDAGTYHLGPNASTGLSYDSANGLKLYSNGTNYWDLKNGYFNFGGVISHENASDYTIDASYLSGIKSFIATATTPAAYMNFATGAYSFGSSSGGAGALYSNGNTAVINANYIRAGSIDASQIAVTNLNASNINAGTLNAAQVTITNLNADNITSGTLSADYIKLFGDMAVYESSTSATPGGSMGYGSSIFQSGMSMHICGPNNVFECGVAASTAWLGATNKGIVVNPTSTTVIGQYVQLVASSEIMIGQSNATNIDANGTWDFTDATVTGLNLTAKFG